MSADLDRDQRVTLIADALRIARERGRRDYSIGFAGAAVAWVERLPNVDVQLRCAANLLRIATAQREPSS